MIEWTREALVGLETSPIPRPEQPRRFDIVFLDRDGTLNVHRPGYVERADDLVMLEGASEAVAQLASLAARIVLVTNQRGIARGLMSLDDLAAVHARLIEELSLAHAHLDAIEVCPHEVGECECRKPLPGQLLRAFARMPWADPAKCLLFGDQDSDLEAAARAGVPSMRVRGDNNLKTRVRQLGDGRHTEHGMVLPS